MAGQLFTSYFLEKGILHTNAAQAPALLENAAYIFDIFPVVRRHDEAAFGHYRTQDMVLAYYNALAAGDTDVDVAV